MSTLALVAVPLAFCTSTAALGLSAEPLSPKPAVTSSVSGEISHSASLFNAALADYAIERQRAVSAIAAGASGVTTAQAALDASAGKTDTEESRAVLAPALDVARLHLGFAIAEMTAATADADFTVPVGALFTDRPNIGESAATLTRLTFAWADQLSSLDSGLPTVAARRAPARAVKLFNKKVWASGFQTEIDACRGAVDVTARYGVPVIAEQWDCGGSRFPGIGTTITLSGVNSGTYRVGGSVAVLNRATDGTASIPRGHDLLYQTCINGSSATMSFAALTRIG